MGWFTGFPLRRLLVLISYTPGPLCLSMEIDKAHTQNGP